MLNIQNLSHSFIQGDAELNILKNCNLNLNKGEIVALVGASGAGKTTFLQIVGLLEKPKSGEIFLDNHNTSSLNDNERTKLRRNFFGFVYQFHHLLPEFDALENVVMAQLIAGVKRKIAQEKACHLLENLGLAHRLHHRPKQLSGGEQQRVAIARALANNPKVLLADEPTGNLDPETSYNVFNMLLNLVKEQNIAALVATHNLELAQLMHRRVMLHNSAIVEFIDH
jgi:lipoprotein-releasing system ATP-binding protein